MRRPSRKAPTSKEQLQQRLKRLGGQVGGIEKMVEGDRYCVDILLQVSAARAAVDQIGLFVLTRHLGHGVDGSTCEGPPTDALTECEQLDELKAAIAELLGKSVEQLDLPSHTNSEDEQP